MGRKQKAQTTLTDKEILDQMQALLNLRSASSATISQSAPSATAFPQSTLKLPTRFPCLYVDGAGQGADGGWGLIFYETLDRVIELGGYAPDTTNNRMELQAAIEGAKLINSLKLEVTVPVYTDSQYVQKGITLWIHNWLRSNWRDHSIKNQDLWEELLQVNEPNLQWQWVKGHSGVVGNERADRIAESFARGKPIDLKDFRLS